MNSKNCLGLNCDCRETTSIINLPRTPHLPSHRDTPPSAAVASLPVQHNNAGVSLANQRSVDIVVKSLSLLLTLCGLASRDSTRRPRAQRTSP